MRGFRWSIIFVTLYLTFSGGYLLLFPVKVFHHLFITALLVAWLGWRIYRRQGLPYTPLNPFLYGVVVVWFITAIGSIDTRVALENVWSPIIHLLFFWVIVDLIQRGRQRIVFEALFMMAVVVIFITALEFASWYFGLGLTPTNSIGWPRIGIWIPPFLPKAAWAMNISTLLAGYSAPLVLVLGVWSLTARRREHRRILALFAFLMAIVLILTFSRGGMLSLLAALGAFSIMRLAQNERARRVLPARYILGGGIIVGVLAMAVYVAFVLRYGAGASDEGRLDMWRSAIEITLDNPLDGVGPGLFGRAFREYRTPQLARDKLASAHNAYLNTAAETGLLGVVISGAVIVVGLRTVWQTYQGSQGENRRLRLEGVIAALIGVACHSMVDVFTTTPLVLMLAALAAYVVVGPRPPLDAIPPSWRPSAVVALGIVVLYGVVWLFWDSAEGYYRASLNNPLNALKYVAQAQTIDPHLKLYVLQESYIHGLVSPREQGIASYLKAIALEPTWDVGLMNLAALYERGGDLSQALDYLDRARTINPLTSATLHWARLAEDLDAAPAETIIEAYGLACRQNPDGLPLADFWWQTPLRQEALRQCVVALPLDAQYRVWRRHDISQLERLIPPDPQTAPEWWIIGERHLALGDATTALVGFDKAIALAPTFGDYYASRARAFIAVGDVERAHQDLDKALVFGARYEYPHAIRASIAATVEEKLTLQAMALSGRVQPQEFSAVLYNRPALFAPLSEVSWVGPGTEALQPWYEIAEYYRAIGDIRTARRVLDAILAYAPYESRALIERSNLD